MPATLATQLTVEKTPSYFVTRRVAERVDHMSRDRESRDFRLLVVVRDPVTRALSDFAQSASKRRRPRKTGDFASLALTAVNGSNASTTTVNAGWGPIRLGLYAVHVWPWLDRFAAAGRRRRQLEVALPRQQQGSTSSGRRRARDTASEAVLSTLQSCLLSNDRYRLRLGLTTRRSAGAEGMGGSSVSLYLGGHWVHRLF